ncbi:MAG: hypothetical protein N2Z84_05645 [Atribacterota bacterium]|nr:hypothetical protein [Atribacterota bacterium]
MRDILTLPFGEHELVIACDALGGIGPKVKDEVRVPLKISARFTTRVAMAEVLSCGAEPLALVLTLSIEPYPFLAEAMEGIREELATIDMENLPLLFSSEKNTRTVQTGLGITVVAQKKPTKLLPDFPLFLYALGVPSCGSTVLTQINQVADLRDLLLLRSLTPFILPVGSQGIFVETMNLIRELKATLRWTAQFPYSIFQSCGPATVLLFASQEENAFTTSAKPVWRIGTLTPL